MENQWWMERPIITDLMDTDYYKITGNYPVWLNYQDVVAEYRFTDRDGRRYPEGYCEALRRQIDMMADASFSDASIAFLREKGGYYLPDRYLDFLASFRLDPNEVRVIDRNGTPDTRVRASWDRAFMYEIYLMATKSQLYYTMTGQEPEPDYEEKAYQKARRLAEIGARWSDFSTRRRAEYEVHKRVLKAALEGSNGNLTGTSNPHFAMMYNLAPIGTHGHELPMGLGAIHGYEKGNEEFLKLWSESYHGHLGIALTDTYTTERFLEKFNAYYAKLFDGVRHDSGDPIAFAKRMIEHYESQHVDPLTRQIVFSDSLTVESIERILEFCHDKFFKVWFGLGTNLSNDVGFVPLNIVIKIYRVLYEGRWRYAIKFSDVPGKVMGHPEAIEVGRFSLQIPR